MTGKANGNLPAFAARLRALMIDRRIGIVTLAEQTGITERLIRKYRAGHATPRDYFGDPSRNARLLAAALGVTPEELIADEAEELAA